MLGFSKSAPRLSLVVTAGETLAWLQNAACFLTSIFLSSLTIIMEEVNTLDSKNEERNDQNAHCTKCDCLLLRPGHGVLVNIEVSVRRR